MKIIIFYYNIDNLVLNSFFRSLTLPYYIYKILQYKSKNKDKLLVAPWHTIINGILDQLDMILAYIGFVGLTIGEYITYRTLSIGFGGMFLIIYHKKCLTLEKNISIVLIFIACSILLGFHNDSKFIYSFICILSSLAYSLLNFIIEITITTNEKRKLNFYWTKLISCVIALFFTLITEYTYLTITSIFKQLSTKDIVVVLILEISIGILENLYYYWKINLINKSNNNGSIIINYLDILRRFSLIIIGIGLFYEKYNLIIYLSLSIMFIGSLIGISNFQIIKNLYIKKTQKNIVVLPEIDLTSITIQ
jgi:hypothetical protein